MFHEAIPDLQSQMIKVKHNTYIIVHKYTAPIKDDELEKNTLTHTHTHMIF